MFNKYTVKSLLNNPYFLNLFAGHFSDQRLAANAYATPSHFYALAHFMPKRH
jgi:hypothetical protein